MKPSDAAIVLTTAAAIDRRTVGRTDAEVWADLLGDMRIEDAVSAVKHHYSTCRDFIYPSNIIDIVKAVRAERIRAAGDITSRMPAAIDAMEDGAEHQRAYKGWLAEARRRVGNGEEIDSFAPMPALNPADAQKVEQIVGELAASLSAKRPAPKCATCGNDREHLVHGGTGRENDHEFKPPTPMPDDLRRVANQEEAHE